MKPGIDHEMPYPMIKRRPPVRSVPRSCHHHLNGSTNVPVFAGVQLDHRQIVTGHAGVASFRHGERIRSEEHTSELQSLMRISYAVFCLKKKTTNKDQKPHLTNKQN